MTDDDLDARVRALLDRDEVARLAKRYSRGVDRLDWEAVRACFTGDAVVTGSQGTAPAAEYVERLRPRVEGYVGTMHFMGNEVVDVDGDEGTVETYAVAIHWSGDPAGSDHPGNLVLGVRYVDKVIRTPAGWRIARREALTDWRVGGAG